MSSNVFNWPVTHVIVVCIVHTHFPQIPEHCLPTKNARVSSCSHRDVVMLFCPSFTQSERFLQTGQLITRLQVVVMTNFIRMLMRNVIVNVFMSVAVIWWAAIFRPPPSSPLSTLPPFPPHPTPHTHTTHPPSLPPSLLLSSPPPLPPNSHTHTTHHTLHTPLPTPPPWRRPFDQKGSFSGFANSSFTPKLFF